MTAEANARWAIADLELERVFTAWRAGRATRVEYAEAIGAAYTARLEALSPDGFRPGPASIPPGQCPGGYVIHVYAAPAGELLWSGPVPARMSAIAAAADAAARAAADHPVTVHVAYDGDDGHRASLVEWARAMIDADG